MFLSEDDWQQHGSDGAGCRRICTVAALAFELENEWTLPASLFVAAICSVLTVRNLYTYRRSLTGRV
jgi:hypothetical protein